MIINLKNLFFFRSRTEIHSLCREFYLQSADFQWRQTNWYLCHRSITGLVTSLCMLLPTWRSADSLNSLMRHINNREYNTSNNNKEVNPQKMHSNRKSQKFFNVSTESVSSTANIQIRVVRSFFFFDAFSIHVFILFSSSAFNRADLIWYCRCTFVQLVSFST